MLVSLRKNKSSKMRILFKSGYKSHISAISCLTLSTSFIRIDISLFNPRAPPQKAQSYAHPLDVIIAASFSP